MSVLNYSKWDNIEISDDEDDTHPNIHTPSLFKWRHEVSFLPLFPYFLKLILGPCSKNERNGIGKGTRFRGQEGDGKCVETGKAIGCNH